MRSHEDRLVALRAEEEISANGGSVDQALESAKVWASDESIIAPERAFAAKVVTYLTIESRKPTDKELTDRNRRAFATGGEFERLAELKARKGDPRG